MQRVLFVKPGRFIDRNQRDVLVVEDASQVFEVSDDFADFHSESVVPAPLEQEPLTADDGDLETSDESESSDESKPRRRRSRKKDEAGVDGEDLLG